MTKANTKKIPRHGEDYIIGTSILDDGKRLLGVVFRDPVEQDLYKVSMTVDTSHRTYSIVRMQFRPETCMPSIPGRHVERAGKRIKCLEVFKKWLKNGRETTTGINFIEHKIQLPVELSTPLFSKVAKSPECSSHSIISSSKSSDDLGCQLVLNDSWTTLNLNDCNGDLTNQMDLANFEDSASSMCIDQLTKLSFEVLEEISTLRKSLSGQEQSGTEVVAKPSTKGSF
ncbi:hypothetical protein ACHAW6_015733 [Cyclotella cf. meneghiniana]